MSKKSKEFHEEGGKKEVKEIQKPVFDWSTLDTL